MASIESNNPTEPHPADITQQLLNRVLRFIGFYESGLMTLGTSSLPVLIGPRPMQSVTWYKLLIRIEVIPPVTLSIPGDIENLQTAKIEFDQILLQRRDTDGG